MPVRRWVRFRLNLTTTQSLPQYSTALIIRASSIYIIEQFRWIERCTSSRQASRLTTRHRQLIALSHIATLTHKNDNNTTARLDRVAVRWAINKRGVACEMGQCVQTTHSIRFPEYQATNCLPAYTKPTNQPVGFVCFCTGITQYPGHKF